MNRGPAFFALLLVAVAFTSPFLNFAEAQNRKVAQAVTVGSLSASKLSAGSRPIAEGETRTCVEGYQCEFISYTWILNAKDVSDGSGARCKYTHLQREFFNCTYTNKDCSKWSSDRQVDTELPSWIVGIRPVSPMTPGR